MFWERMSTPTIENKVSESLNINTGKSDDRRDIIHHKLEITSVTTNKYLM